MGWWRVVLEALYLRLGLCYNESMINPILTHYSLLSESIWVD